MFAKGGFYAGYAGEFVGDVYVEGALIARVKNFRIDHPLDPANKYLHHASVESSEMKNVYDGVALLDAGGAAVVELPEWFGVLNKDFRYQLTAIGAPGPNPYIAQGVQNNTFRIAGGRPGMKVSWQVTGVRQDAYAKANPLVVEQPKSAREQGYSIYPELYGQPEEKGILWSRNPAQMKKVQALRSQQSGRKFGPPPARGTVAARAVSRP